jgi:predicted Zn-ribbon and HTH transcriptional regulator
MIDLRIEAQNRSFSRRSRLNHAILKNTYWFLPVDDKGHENYVPVGRGVPSSDFCGRWVSLSVCKNVEGHRGVSLAGTDCTGKVVVRHNHMWCTKSSCPVCFIRGWSTREARSIAGRFVEADKRGFGKVEHVMVSVPVADRDLPESVLRGKCRDALFDRGVVGGCMIFHGYREGKDRKSLVWSPHFHVLGFIEGGFGICRDCVHVHEDCESCSGFKGREVRGYGKDGYIVKVHDARKTVVGSAWYQLNHATVRIGMKRFQSVTWFGVCSYRKFKSEKVRTESLCPACDSEMVRCFYMGKRYIVKDVGSADYVPLFVDDEFDANGEPNFVDVLGGRFG